MARGGDPFKHVRSGEKFRPPAALVQNALLDVARKQLGDRGSTGAGFGGTQFEHLFAGTILVKNDSGQDVPRFHCLGLGDPIFDPGADAAAERSFSNRIGFKAVTPGDGTHTGKFCILAEPLKDGALGRAWTHGLAIALIWGGADPPSEITAVDVQEGQTTLEILDGGSAKVLWHETPVASENFYGIIKMEAGRPICVVPGRILIVTGSGSSATYDASGLDLLSQLSVEDATPVNRPFGSLDIIEAAVDDPCQLQINNDGEVVLVQLTEVIDPSDCDGEGEGGAAADSDQSIIGSRVFGG